MTGPVGVGLGLRWDFLEEVLDRRDVDVAFFEVSPENYMRRGGHYPAALERVRDRWPIVTHGLAMSLGGVEPPPRDYLADLRREIERVDSPWHSDHVCFGTAGDRVLHDLLPLKLCAAAADHVADRVRAARDALGRSMAVENISWYAHPGRPEMGEAEFLTRIVERADCGLLLDVNNVYVNSLNHAFDAEAFVDSLPLDRVVQIHVAGHTPGPDGLVIDTHGAPVADPVLALLERALARTGPVPVLLERDNWIPPLDALLEEVRRVAEVYERATAGTSPAARDGAVP